MSEDVIDVEWLLEVRTLGVRSEPGTVLLRVETAEGEVRHYALAVAELARLAERLRADALCLSSEAAGTG